MDEPEDGPMTNLKKTHKIRADLTAVLIIALALPAYYKIKFLLEGKMNFADILHPAGLFEVLFAGLLAVLLISFYRLGNRLGEKLNQAIWHRLFPFMMLALAVPVAILFTRFFFNYVVPWGTEPSFEFDVAILAILLPLIVSGVADRIFLEGEKKRADQAVLLARFETLKTRLSPHFLFNSLNALADIVEEDPQLAIRFIEEMASIYRYILDHQNHSLVTLKSEIHAIKSLLFLYEQRHPGAFQLQLNVDETSELKLIVPLALQTLIENALKHNHYNATTPLTLKIQAKDDNLLIENNVNLRDEAASTFTGLDNLARRIRFVCQRSLSVHQVAGVFSVAVPLLDNKPS